MPMVHVPSRSWTTFGCTPALSANVAHRMVETLHGQRRQTPRAIDAVTAVSYYTYMSDMTATDARERFSEALVASSREPVFITRHGKRVAALVTTEFYERAIEALEDAEDIAAARAALDEEDLRSPGRS